MWTVGVAKGTLKFIQSILRILQGSMQVYVIALFILIIQIQVIKLMTKKDKTQHFLNLYTGALLMTKNAKLPASFPLLVSKSICFVLHRCKANRRAVIDHICWIHWSWLVRSWRPKAAFPNPEISKIIRGLPSCSCLDKRNETVVLAESWKQSWYLHCLRTVPWPQ